MQKKCLLKNFLLTAARALLTLMLREQITTLLPVVGRRVFNNQEAHMAKKKAKKKATKKAAKKATKKASKKK